MKSVISFPTFGDKFKTNTLETAIFHYEENNLYYFILPNGDDLVCGLDGKSIYDKDVYIEESLENGVTVEEVLDAGDFAFDCINEENGSCHEYSFSIGFQEGVDWLMDLFNIKYKKE